MASDGELSGKAMGGCRPPQLADDPHLWLGRNAPMRPMGSRQPSVGARWSGSDDVFFGKASDVRGRVTEQFAEDIFIVFAVAGGAAADRPADVGGALT
jgi:hypothetical protein